MQTTLKKEIVGNISTHVGQNVAQSILIMPKCGLLARCNVFINKKYELCTCRDSFLGW